MKAPAVSLRWRRMQENGAIGTVTVFAAAEKINSSYVSRVLRLTLLSPDIVEAIMGGRQGAEVTLPALMARVAVEWDQRSGRQEGENVGA